MPTRAYDIDAVVIGSGPNGLSAAIAIAQKGHSVVVYEAQNTIGGGARSAELTLPGFIHDVCSSVHPLAAASPFFQTLELERFGLRWVMPEIALAHPFDNGEAAAIQAPFGSNLSQFGTDAHAIRQLVGPLVQFWADISKDVPGPPRLPAHPLALARFGFKALQSARKVSRRFRTEKARAVFAGMAAHSVLPLDYWASASFGLFLWASCYSVGWPFAAGGSQTIADALTKVLRSHGGEIFTNHPIMNLSQLLARPTWRLYRTSVPRAFLCSASTPPGPGAHGMCGYRAALLALEQCFQSEAR